MSICKVLRFVQGGTLYSVPFVAIGKPRMTQRDKWMSRACVARYREFKHKMQIAFAGELPEEGTVLALSMIAHFPMPKSWSQKRRDEMRGKPHRQKPDVDNCFKAVCDSLFSEDSQIAFCSSAKLWDDGKGPRIEILITTEEGII